MPYLTVDNHWNFEAVHQSDFGETPRFLKVETTHEEFREY
jgi:hypothetical protein